MTDYFVDVKFWKTGIALQNRGVIRSAAKRVLVWDPSTGKGAVLILNSFCYQNFGL